MSHYRVEVYCVRPLGHMFEQVAYDVEGPLQGITARLAAMMQRLIAGSFALVIEVGAFEHDEDVLERWRVAPDGRVLRSRYSVLDTEHEVAPVRAKALTGGARL